MGMFSSSPVLVKSTQWSFCVLMEEHAIHGSVLFMYHGKNNLEVCLRRKTAFSNLSDNLRFEVEKRSERLHVFGIFTLMQRCVACCANQTMHCSEHRARFSSLHWLWGYVICLILLKFYRVFFFLTFRASDLRSTERVSKSWKSERMPRQTVKQLLLFIQVPVESWWKNVDRDQRERTINASSCMQPILIVLLCCVFRFPWLF